MLVVKVFVNTRQIDEIHVQNVGCVHEKNNLYEYKVRLPENRSKSIFHKRDLGYVPLLKNVLDYLWYEEN